MGWTIAVSMKKNCITRKKSGRRWCFRCVRVCDEGMDVKALGVGARGVNSVILPNKPGELACEECGMCIDICPVGALTSGTYRYQTRPWEMKYVPDPREHCSNGCKTTLG